MGPWEQRKESKMLKVISPPGGYNLHQNSGPADRLPVRKRTNGIERKDYNETLCKGFLQKPGGPPLCGAEPGTPLIFPKTIDRFEQEEDESMKAAWKDFFAALVALRQAELSQGVWNR